MHHPTDKTAYTTIFGTPVVEHWLEREIGINQTTHRTMRKRSTSRSCLERRHDYIKNQRIGPTSICHVTTDDVLHTNKNTDILCQLALAS